MDKKSKTIKKPEKKTHHVKDQQILKQVLNKENIDTNKKSKGA